MKLLEGKLTLDESKVELKKLYEGWYEGERGLNAWIEDFMFNETSYDKDYIENFNKIQDFKKKWKSMFKDSKDLDDANTTYDLGMNEFDILRDEIEDHYMSRNKMPCGISDSLDYLEDAMGEWLDKAVDRINKENPPKPKSVEVGEGRYVARVTYNDGPNKGGHIDFHYKTKEEAEKMINSSKELDGKMDKGFRGSRQYEVIDTGKEEALKVRKSKKLDEAPIGLDSGEYVPQEEVGVVANTKGGYIAGFRKTPGKKVEPVVGHTDEKEDSRFIGACRNPKNGQTAWKLITQTAKKEQEQNQQLEEGVYADCEKEIEKCQDRIKQKQQEIKDILKGIEIGSEAYENWISQEDKEKIELLDEEIGMLDEQIGGLRGYQAEIRYIDNGDAYDYSDEHLYFESKQRKHRKPIKEELTVEYIVYDEDGDFIDSFGELDDAKKCCLVGGYEQVVKTTWNDGDIEDEEVVFDNSVEMESLEEAKDEDKKDDKKSDKKDDKKSSKKDTKKKDKKEKEDEEDIDIEDELDIDVEEKDLPDVDVDDMLSLDDIDIDVDEPIIDEPTEEIPQEIVSGAKLGELQNAVRDEFGSIDHLKSLIATITLDDENAQEGDEDLIDIINGAIDLKYELIGMLNKGIELLDGETVELMDKGEERAEDILDGDADIDTDDIEIEDGEDVFGGGQDLEITDKFDVDRAEDIDVESSDAKSLFDIDDEGIATDEIEDDVVIKDKKPNKK